METKSIIVLVISGVLTALIVSFWGFGKISWEQAVIAFGLLVTPSAGSALMNRGPQ